MSYLVNSIDDIVVEAIDGVLYTNNSLSKLDDNTKQIKVVIRNDWFNSNNANKVALISGGGEGHFPAHIGFVGEGMLTGAVAGNIFASPSSQAVLSAILATKSSNVILIVKNYTGDRLNFGLAAEIAKNQYNVNVQTILVADDVVQRKDMSVVGRRGLAGVVIVEKIVGAAAEINKFNINELVKLGQQVSENLVSIGIATTSCNLPGQDNKHHIPQGKAELGIGIHGEAGREIISVSNMNQTVKTMIDTILTNDQQHNYAQDIIHKHKLNDKKRVIVMINNTQALTAPELGIATKNTVEYLQSLNYIVERVYSGLFLSSLDMRGFSITLLYITDDSWLQYLDANTSCSAWPKASIKINKQINQKIELPKLKQVTSNNSSNNVQNNATTDKIKHILTSVADALISHEKEINELDAIAGDSDAGSTFAVGGKRLKQELNNIPYNNAADACYHIADTVCNSMGGSSGAVLAILLLGTSNKLKQSGNNSSSSSLHNIIDAFNTGIESVHIHSGSIQGSRSMLDSIIPALQALKNANTNDITQLLELAAKAAEQGVEDTKTMKAKVGRASYISADQLKGICDAGAKAIAVAFRAAANAVKQ